MKKMKDISIAKKLYFIVGAMAILIVIELVSLWFAIHTLSSVRALVGAEGLWSKGQKDAVYNLRKYNLSHKEADYAAFKKFMEVPLGDHITRLELLKPEPDMAIAREGFIKGRIHPDDIDGMITLLMRFHNNYYIGRAIDAWTKADKMIVTIMPVAEMYYRELHTAKPDAKKLGALMAEVDRVNEALTLLEDDFSYTLGEGSRWLENLILKILLSVAITVEFTGLILTIVVTRSMTRELNEINKATSKITKGDLSARAKVISKNEIGQVAMQVNRMTQQLVVSNKELGQVAYIASHDLQEPLRTISNFVALFQRKYKGKLDAAADEYLTFISDGTARMQQLVKDLLDYSRIGNDKKLQKVNCNDAVQDVLQNMAVNIKVNQATVHVAPLPVIDGYAELPYLFQNLVSNAIKFKKKDVDPVIHVAAVGTADEWTFTVTDNGIGIEPVYHKRIFTIFQRLHTNSEYSGTGIGLAHCKKIIELHRGKIWVNSTPGHGTTFYFTIPKLNT